MKKAVFVPIVAVFAMAVGLTDAFAVEKVAVKPAAKKSSSYVNGILSVTKNDKGGVEAITITTKSLSVYNVDMAGFDQDCSEKDGKEVKAYGEVKEVDGKMYLKVNGKIMKVGGDKPDKKKEPAAAGKQK